MERLVLRCLRASATISSVRPVRSQISQAVVRGELDSRVVKPTLAQHQVRVGDNRLHRSGATPGCFSSFSALLSTSLSWSSHCIDVVTSCRQRRVLRLHRESILVRLEGVFGITEELPRLGDGHHAVIHLLGKHGVSPENGPAAPPAYGPRPAGTPSFMSAMTSSGVSSAAGTPRCSRPCDPVITSPPLVNLLILPAVLRLNRDRVAAQLPEPGQSGRLHEARNGADIRGGDAASRRGRRVLGGDQPDHQRVMGDVVGPGVRAMGLRWRLTSCPYTVQMAARQTSGSRGARVRNTVSAIRRCRPGVSPVQRARGPEADIPPAVPAHRPLAG
jgi:hypothetical protein